LNDVSVVGTARGRCVKVGPDDTLFSTVHRRPRWRGKPKPKDQRLDAKMLASEKERASTSCSSIGDATISAASRSGTVSRKMLTGERLLARHA